MDIGQTKHCQHKHPPEYWPYYNIHKLARSNEALIEASALNLQICQIYKLKEEYVALHWLVRAFGTCIVFLLHNLQNVQHNPHKASINILVVISGSRSRGENLMSDSLDCSPSDSAWCTACRDDFGQEVSILYVLHQSDLYNMQCAGVWGGVWICVSLSVMPSFLIGLTWFLKSICPVRDLDCACAEKRLFGAEMDQVPPGNLDCLKKVYMRPRRPQC